MPSFPPTEITPRGASPKPRISSRRLFALGLIVAGVSLAAVALLLRQLDDEVARGRHSLLLVTLDTTRADHLAPYGGDVEVPALSRLAADGILFDRAYSVAPITLVAHTSIHTGLWPPQTGVRNNGIHFAGEELETLAERLAGRGWRTAAFVSAAVLEQRYGLSQGFEIYDDDLSAGTTRLPRTVPDRPASATVDAARAWLDQLPDGQRFFLWVHFYDPHAPYQPPSPFREAWPSRPYDGEIAYLDSELGRLLEHPKLAATDDLVTAVLGDHGESLGEHGEQTHALLAYDATLRVPFFLRWPGGPRGARVPWLVSQVDLVPSLLDLLGLPTDPRLPGSSVVPGSARGREVAGGSRLLYSETYLPHYTYGWAKLRVARRGPFKYIAAPTPELYDLRLDPRELSNLQAQQPGAAHDLARDLEEWLGELDDTERESTQSLDAESEAELRSLGYLAAGALPEREGPDPDPKDMIDVHTGLERARQLQADGLFDLAATELRQVLTRDPNNLAARIDLADNLASQGELDAAALEAEGALALDPSSARLHLQLAMIEAQRRRPEQALALVERALELDPRQVEASIQKTLLLRRLGRSADAVSTLQEALDRNPDHPRLLTAYAATVLAPAGRVEEAEALLRRALALDPFLGVAARRLGDLLEQSGRTLEAVEIYQQGVARQPRDAELQARLGLLLARLGDERAEGPLREAIRLAENARTDVFLALANWLDERGRGEGARQVFEHLLEREATGPRARNNRALALFGLGRLEESRRSLEALLAEFPKYLDALSNLAAVAGEQGDWPAAETYARQLIALQGDAPDGWNNLGVALEGSGRLKEAADAYRRALELDPGYWRAKVNLENLVQPASKPSPARPEPSP